MLTYLDTTISLACLAVVTIEGGALNLALNKPAFQSSTIRYPISSVAGNAVDGNSDSDWVDGSCAHTDHLQSETDRWWMVDLLQAYSVTAVTIVKRQDRFLDHLRDFVVETFRSNPSVFPGAQGSVCKQYDGIFPPNETLHCRKSLIGRFVRIRKRPPETVMLCEVSVQGSDGTFGGNPRTGKYSSIPGKYLKANSTVTRQKTSRILCGVTCLRNVDCQAFQFRHVTSTCIIVKKTWETDGITPNQSWDLYFM